MTESYLVREQEWYKTTGVTRNITQAKPSLLAVSKDRENAGLKSENLGIGAGTEDCLVALEFGEPHE